MNPPRLVIDALSARFGGTAYAAIQTAKHLARGDDFAEVVVVARRGSMVANGLAPIGRLRVLLLPAATRGELLRRLLWEGVRLPRVVARGGQTVVLTWSGMLPRRPGAHITSFISNPLMFAQDGLANRVRRRAVRQTAVGETRIVAPTAAMAALASRALGTRVAVVPFGVDHTRFAPADEQGDEILCVADFYPHKRHDVVVDAWVALPPPRPRLRLIGNPDVPATTYGEVLARVRRYRHLGEVKLEQDLPLSDLIGAYRGSRVFVIASEHESFCMPLLEALACGVPAVARDLPVLHETGGPGTRFVAANDVASWRTELYSLLMDHEAHQHARRCGLIHARQFSWESTAARLRDSLLGGGGTRQPW